MKVEIKKIPVLSVLFSVFPLAVFVVMLITALMEMFNPEVTVNLTYIMGLAIRAVQSTILTLVSVVFFVWTYNLLCAIGIRGIHLELEDK